MSKEKKYESYLSSLASIKFSIEILSKIIHQIESSGNLEERYVSGMECILHNMDIELIKIKKCINEKYP